MNFQRSKRKLMKKIIVFVVIAGLILTASYMFYKKQPLADPLAGLRPESISIVHLLARPKKYEGKIVSVYGFFSNSSKPLPTIYLNEMYAKANDRVSGVIIDLDGKITIYDHAFNVYRHEGLDTINGCFINVWGRIVDGRILSGNISIYIDDECAKRFEKSDILYKGALADFKNK